MLASKLNVVGEPVDTIFFRPISPISRSKQLARQKLSNRLQNSYPSNGGPTTLAQVWGSLGRGYGNGSERPESMHAEGAEGVVFLFVGKWEERKGIGDLVEAYFRSFSTNENVLLLIGMPAGA